MRNHSCHDTTQATSLCDRGLGHHKQVSTHPSYLFLHPCSVAHGMRPDNVGSREVRLFLLRSCCVRRSTRNPCMKWCNTKTLVPLTYRVAEYGRTTHDANQRALQGQQVSQVVDGVSRGECRFAVPKSSGRLRGRTKWVSWVGWWWSCDNCGDLPDMVVNANMGL